jgi:hypothetical protein
MKMENKKMPFLNALFWVFFASYVVHLLDETMMNGGFVRWVVQNFWPQYRVRMFFWFNAGAVAAIIVGNVLFDCLGGHWVILPIVWIAGFVTHTFTFHLYWTIRRDTYSPGLATSLLYVVIFYLLIRYGVGGGLVDAADVEVGSVVGIATIGAFLTVGPTVLFPRLAQRRSVTDS